MARNHDGGRERRWSALATLLALAALASPAVTTASAPAALEVVASGPTGEITALSESVEIRLVFSEPMVALGRVPDPVVAPWLSIAPATEGALRWSGTRTLIFTPARPLPYGTRFEVEVAASTASLSGATLAAPYRFSFTTPTLRLVETSWYRRGGRYDAPLLIALRFNQPVVPSAVARHVTLRYEPHAWTAPTLSAEDRGAMLARDPEAVAAFDEKVRRTREVTQRDDFLVAEPVEEWDASRFVPGEELLVLRTATAPPPDAWIRVRVGPAAVGAQGNVGPGEERVETLQLEATLFVTGFRCAQACDPDDYNPLRFRGRLDVGSILTALRVRDVSPGDEPRGLATRAAVEADETPAPYDYWGSDYARSSALPLDRAGISTLPGRRYEVALAPDLTALDGQTLDYAWLGNLDNWHRMAYSSFGAGHGVWEASGGSELPFYVRNLTSVRYWLRPLGVEELMPTLLHLRRENHGLAPDVPPVRMPLRLEPDAVESRSLPLGDVLSERGRGLVFAALQDGEPIERARAPQKDTPEGGLIQVTDLGVSVKDSPQGNLVLVTRLSDGRPVPGAEVGVRNLDNALLWSGLTGEDGTASTPALPLRQPREGWWDPRFVVTASKDDDVAYVSSDWTEGVEPWAFSLRYDLDESQPVLRGSVFADRGVYKPGEEVRLKAIVRTDTPEGIRLLPAGTEAKVEVHDSQGDLVDTRVITLGEWSSAEWSLVLPGKAALGHHGVSLSVEGQQVGISGSFLVAAYRRPDFRVDAQLGADGSLAGVELEAAVSARYLFGAPMPGLPVRWTLTRQRLDSVPDAVTDRFPRERFAYLLEDWYANDGSGTQTVQGDTAALDAQGAFEARFSGEAPEGLPWRYTFEGEVTDVSRQTIAGRASFRIDPAPFYLALSRPGYFTDSDEGLSTEVVAVGLDGEPVPGLEVAVELVRMQWHGARRAEGEGFYGWDTERREVAVASWDVVTQDAPVSVTSPLEEGGSYLLRARARDAEGRHTVTTTSFYVLGSGYTAWERYDHNRIDLIPERTTYRPGETARLMVRSPWESATALLTTEREGIRSHEVFELTSTQQTVEVALTPADVPNLYVSVLLVKGRTQAPVTRDDSDPGKPAFRLGYAELKVEDPGRRLGVEVSTDAEAYRPAESARVVVTVSDAGGSPAAAEVTLWAVDHGVLSLTGYQPPDLVDAVYVDKALQVLNLDSRQRLISRRAIVPKGGDEGGGGGGMGGPGTSVRKDFRVLAFWLGSLHTDATGRASTEVTLPEDLTTYRIMALAADRDSRFGSGQREIRIDKPLLLTPAFPRFLAEGDTARFGAVVHSQLADARTGRVTLESLDPGVLVVLYATPREVELAAGGSREVRFDVIAKSPGTARLRMSVVAGDHGDAFELSLPVRSLATPETVAAYGRTDAEATEGLTLPEGASHDRGGLHLELASSALVGLGEGARYLVDYPYGCAEQRASAALALLLAADLGEAFRLEGIASDEITAVARRTLAELPDYQCPDGGFAYWSGGCRFTSEYLTSYLLHVMQRAEGLGHPVDAEVSKRAYDYLEERLRADTQPRAGAYSLAGQAFAVRVLARGGRNVDSALTRLHARLDDMPVFALADLYDAELTRDASGSRAAELSRRLTNAIAPEGGAAHVEERDDPELTWLWSSNVRSTATTLGALVRGGAAEPLHPALVRWLLQVREKGRWGNTQENARALEALVDYYRRYERAEPDFEAAVRLGVEELFRATFEGRSTEALAHEVPLSALLERNAPGASLPLRFHVQGTGHLHYLARLDYAAPVAADRGLDAGFQVEREYAPARPDDAPATTRFAAGDLLRVTLRLSLTKERRFVAVTDPLPAGLEPVEAWFETTAADLAREQTAEDAGGEWQEWWQRGGFDHVERHDERVRLFATRLGPGEHVFTYLARATTAGTFNAGPARAEEMYTPEVFGRTGTTSIEVRP